MSDDEDRAANDDVQHVVDALRRHDPQVQPELIAKLVEQVAPGPRTRKDLLTYLREHPDVVTQGGSRMPKVVGELFYAAIAAGVKGVVSPACASCARPRTLFHNTTDGQRICPSCYNRVRPGHAGAALERWTRILPTVRQSSCADRILRQLRPGHPRQRTSARWVRPMCRLLRQGEAGGGTLRRVRAIGHARREKGRSWRS